MNTDWGLIAPRWTPVISAPFPFNHFLSSQYADHSPANCYFTLLTLTYSLPIAVRCVDAGGEAILISTNQVTDLIGGLVGEIPSGIFTWSLTSLMLTYNTLSVSMFYWLNPIGNHQQTSSCFRASPHSSGDHPREWAVRISHAVKARSGIQLDIWDYSWMHWVCARPSLLSCW